MFEHLLVENFGIFKHLEWQEHQKINILIGENDTGKTYLLKLLYCVAKSIEEYKDYSEPGDKTWGDIFSEKISRVYPYHQQNIGEIVRQGSNDFHLEVLLKRDAYRYSFFIGSKNTVTQHSEASKTLDFNALYIPSKEILTVCDLASIDEQLKIFGFDQTYNDLLQALRKQTCREKLDKGLEDIVDNLQTLYPGEIVIEDERFIFQRELDKYEISQVGDGIKKTGMIITLIRNRTIRKGTILFIDELETNLHPRTIIALCKTLFALSQFGIQLYLVTHSYFVLKQFEILARQHQESIQLCSLEKAEDINITFSDLKEGMLDNHIIDTSIKLYEEDVRLDIEA